MEDLIKANITKALFEKYGTLYVEKPIALELLNIGATKFEEMRRLGVTPKETRLPSPTGTGKLLYHIADLAEYQIGAKQ